MAIEIPDREDRIDFPGIMEGYEEEQRAKRLALSAIVLSGGAAAIMNKPEGYIAKKALDNFSNYLGGYYSGTPFAKQGAVIKEAARSGVGVITDYFNPFTSQAYEATGLTGKTWKELNDYQAELNKLYNDFNQLKRPNKTQIRDINKKVKTVHQKINAKLISDSTNYSMFDELKGTGTVVENYGKLSKQINVLDYSKAKKHLGRSDAIAEILTKNQGIDIKNTLYALKTKNVTTGDVLRGVQFDPRVANFFKQMNERGNKATLGEIKSILGEKNVVTRGKKIFFHTSPKFKPDFDWGGYQGVVEYDTNKPGKVKLHANDMRDWGRFKVGNRDVLNIVRPKEIGIPTILKKIKEPKVSTKKPDTPGKIYKRVKKDVKIKDPRPKAVREAVDLVKSQYMTSKQTLSRSFMKRFLISRLGAVGGAVAFALLLKEIYDNR